MEYIIDGEKIFSLEDFYDEFSRVVCPNMPRVTNLDALDDVLYSDVGMPLGGFTLRWRHSGLSRERLGYEETIKQLKLRIIRCHVGAIQDIRRQISEANLKKAKQFLIGY